MRAARQGVSEVSRGTSRPRQWQVPARLRETRRRRTPRRGGAGLGSPGLPVCLRRSGRGRPPAVLLCLCCGRGGKRRERRQLVRARAPRPRTSLAAYGVCSPLLVLCCSRGTAGPRILHLDGLVSMRGAPRGRAAVVVDVCPLCAERFTQQGSDLHKPPWARRGLGGLRRGEKYQSRRRRSHRKAVKHAPHLA